MPRIAVSSPTYVEDENSGRIAAATSATGHVSHHGWLLVIRALNHHHRRPAADPITTTAGPESPVGTEDPVYVMRASDVVLSESGIRARVLPETKAQNLTVLLQIYGYLAFSSGRYPQSVVEITGLTAPTF